MTALENWKTAYEHYCDALAIETAARKLCAGHNFIPTSESVEKFKSETLAALDNLQEAFSILTHDELEEAREYVDTRKGKNASLLTRIVTRLGDYNVIIDYTT